MIEITKDNFMDQAYPVFRKFSRQLAVLTAGTMEDFNSMTIGWGMLGNVWGHAPGITVYVSPSRYTQQFLEKYEFFTVCFFDEAHHGDVMTLGTTSGRDGDKIARTSLTPVALPGAVGFKEAELTLVCRKVYGAQFNTEKLPEFTREMYKRFAPHYEYIGVIEDAFGAL